VELRQSLTVLRKWLWLIALGSVLGLVSAFGLSVLSIPIYQSTLTLLVNQGSGDPNNVYNAILTSNSVAPTYVEQIKSSVVLEKVVRDLALPYSVHALKNALNVQQVRNTQLIQISVEDVQLERAQAIATALAQAFIEFSGVTQQARYAAAQQGLDQQIADVQMQLGETQQALASLENPIDTGDPTTATVNRAEQLRLQLALSTYQAQYSVLLKSAQDFRLAATRYGDSVIVSSPAELPLTPVRPTTLLNSVLGLLIGLVLGVGSAFLIEFLDDTIKSPDDVARALKLSTLGLIARFPKASDLRGLVTVNTPRAPYAEAYRNLRTNIQFALLDHAAPTIVITSAEPGEGKSTTLANLGVAIAQLGKRVILVDTDLRRPTLHRLFEVAQEPGLTNLFLNEEINLSDVLVSTRVPNLRLLPCGKIPPNPAELIGSESMSKLIDALKQQADFVLFDTPPVLPVTDAALLAVKARNLLWVVAAGQTRVETTLRVKEALLRVDTKILGIVLNRAVPGRGYGYEYYYYAEGDRRQRKPAPRWFGRWLNRRRPQPDTAASNELNSMTSNRPAVRVRDQ
jgi:non-specific protein-tyrosine kinase